MDGIKQVSHSVRLFEHKPMAAVNVEESPRVEQSSDQVVLGPAPSQRAAEVAKVSEQPVSRPAPLQSLGTGLLGEKLTMTGNGVIFSEDPALETYAETVRGAWTTPADPSGTHPQSRLMAANTLSTMWSAGAVTSPTPAGNAALAFALQYMKPEELMASNAGYYHSAAHPLNVAGTAGEVARGLGRGEARTQFIQQVALLHDADERLDLHSEDKHAKPGTPARVQATLAWMDKNQPALQQRFGWDANHFLQAKAMIARTDFPFDDKPRQIGTPYDGKSPQGLYKELLQQLPAADRKAVMEDAVALSYADQVGNYTGTIQQSEATVRGLAREIGVNPETMLKSSWQFQKSVGQDIAFDQKLGQELHVDGLDVPTRQRLEAALSPESRSNLMATGRYFEDLAARS